jgi:hypothetical protein
MLRVSLFFATTPSATGMNKLRVQSSYYKNCTGKATLSSARRDREKVADWRAGDSRALPVTVFLLCAVALALLPGCKKSSSSEAGGTNQNLQLQGNRLPAMPVPVLRQPALVARFHWVGHNALTNDPTAAYVTQIWNLPETAKLQDLLESKLAAALAGETFNPTNPSATNSALLKPLVADLVEHETYFETRQATNESIEFSLAVKLDPVRAALWQTNLAVFLISKYQALHKPVMAWIANGAQFKVQTNAFVSIVRSGDWTALSLEVTDQGELLGEMVKGIRDARTPFAPPDKHFWLEANLDLPRLFPIACTFLSPAASSSTIHHPSSIIPLLPQVAVAITGDGSSVITRAQANFPKPLPFEVEPWNIPTNLILGQLNSFTAVQGFGPWLATSRIWQNLQLGPPPNQLFLWADQAMAQKTYFAAPLSNADAVVSNAIARLMNENSWFTNNTMGGLQPGPYGSGLDWTCAVGMPIVRPFFESAKGPEGDFIHGGIVRGAAGGQPLPAAMRNDLFSKTNMVYYDREITRVQIDTWLFNSQSLRLICYKQQLPPDSASVVLLKALSQRLGSSGTIISKTGPAQLTLFRTSPIGFTAFELHLLADWFESPTFPRGLHTFTAPPVGHGPRMRASQKPLSQP